MFVFIEANPFASRLHVLKPLLDAAASFGAEEVSVVHSAREMDPHWRRWRSSLPACTKTVPVMPSRPMKQASKIGPIRLTALLWRVLRVAKRGDTVTFDALDDYLVAAVICIPILFWIRIRGINAFVLKYRVQDVFLHQSRLRPVLIGLSTRTVLRATGGRMVVFDERFESATVAVLPDPWSGDFGGISAETAKRALGIDNSRPVVGLIGYQDERKGFATAARALTALKAQGWDGQVLILGRVADQLQTALRTVVSDYGSAVFHQPCFVSDEDLPTYFAACDVIWLPYHARFSASSGVLSRSAASGVPVVATDGGLIAHRIRAHRLGLVSAQGDATSLAAATTRVLKWNQGFDQERALNWAASCHEQRTEVAARRLFKPYV